MIMFTPAPLRPAQPNDWRADDWRCGRTEMRTVSISHAPDDVDNDVDSLDTLY